VKPAATAADERDALWALAPAGNEARHRGAARGVAMLERGALVIQELLASSADFAAMNAELMRELLTRMGTTNPTLATLGLAMATVWRRSRARTPSLTLVLPVVDRAKSSPRCVAPKAPMATRRGADLQAARRRYVCAQRRETLAGLGRRGLDPVRAKDPARGDVELVLQDLPPGSQPLRRWTSSARGDRAGHGARLPPAIVEGVRPAEPAARGGRRSGRVRRYQPAAGAGEAAAGAAGHGL